jgi:small subunit ribosomal protein S17
MTEPTTTAARRIVRKQGVVVSAKMTKTITVRIDRMVRHPKYKKIIRRTSKAHAHDEKGEAREGDLVEIEFSRPLSKTKRWVLVSVMKKGPEWKAEEAALDAAAVAAAGGAKP